MADCVAAAVSGPASLLDLLGVPTQGLVRHLVGVHRPEQAGGEGRPAVAGLYLFAMVEVFYNRQRHRAALWHHTLVEFAAAFDPETATPCPP